LRNKQVEANSRAVAQRPAVVYATPQTGVQTVTPQSTAPTVTYVNTPYVYPSYYPTYSYSYGWPLYYYPASYGYRYPSSYCYRYPASACYRPYGYSYWGSRSCWPSGASYGVSAGYRSSYCARPASGFYSSPGRSAHFARR
jgi:hypothetical protein